MGNKSAKEKSYHRKPYDDKRDNMGEKSFFEVLWIFTPSACIYQQPRVTPGWTGKKTFD